MITNLGGQLSESLDLSSLTQVSEGYSSQAICTAVKETLSNLRFNGEKFKDKILVGNDFIAS